MLERGELEVEVAVVRGKEVVSRSVFRSPHGFSIGSAPGASISIPDSPLPPLIQVVEFRNGKPTLLFTADSQLEVDADGDRLDAVALVERGMAEAGDGHHRLGLADGVRAIFRLGALRLLIKTRVTLDVSVWDLRPGQVGTCGGCSSSILWPPSTKPGALVPCSECGDLNRFSQEGVQASGGNAVAPDGTASSLPSSDAISRIKSAGGLTTRAAVQAMEDRLEVGPASDAFDEDDEATDVLHAREAEVQETFGRGISPGKAESPAPMSPEEEEEEEEAPTDPGRPAADLSGSVVIPPTVPRAAALRESTGLESAPMLKRVPTGDAFFAPRKRRPKPKPNRLGWALVFFGMVSGLTGLVLLLLVALQITGGA